MAGDHQIAGHRNRGTVDQEEGIPQARIQIRLHDQIGRFAIRQPDTADRGHRGADHDRVANVSDRRRRQQQDDDQRPNGEPDHRDAVKDPGGEGHHCGHRNDGGQNCSPIAAQQGKGEPFQQTGLSNHRNEERQAENEQHGVGVDQIIQAVE